MSGERHFFISGKPGVGKTTLIKTLALELPTDTAGGFYTEELRAEKRRVGFRLVALSGEEAILAHKQFTGRRQVGHYHVSQTAMEAVGVRALEHALTQYPVVLIDEIGRMELFSHAFCTLVVRALDQARLVIATVPAVHEPFVDHLKSRQDVKVLRLTKENRTAIRATLYQAVMAAVDT